jgi:hypothetical protein
MNIKWIYASLILVPFAALNPQQQPVAGQSETKKPADKAKPPPPAFRDVTPKALAPVTSPVPRNMPLFDSNGNPHPQALEKLYRENIRASEQAMQYRPSMPIIVPDKNIDYKIQIIRPNPKVDYKIQQLKPGGWHDGRETIPGDSEQIAARNKALEEALNRRHDALVKPGPQQGEKK